MKHTLLGRPFFGSCGVSPLDLHQDVWGGKGSARWLGQWVRELLESPLASLGIVCSITFSPRRDDNLMLVFCDHLWSFLFFLLCLVVQQQPGRIWTLFQQGQNCWKGLKGEAALSLAVLAPCYFLLPTTALVAPWHGEAWLPGTACCLPIQAFCLCHQYLACIDGCQWLSGAGKHLAEFSSGFKACFACSCSGHSSAQLQKRWFLIFFSSRDKGRGEGGVKEGGSLKRQIS